MSNDPTPFIDIDALIHQYRGALEQLASGVSIAKTDLGPACTAIREELGRQRVVIADLRLCLDQMRRDRDIERASAACSAQTLLNQLGRLDDATAERGALLNRNRELALERDCEHLKAVEATNARLNQRGELKRITAERDAAEARAEKAEASAEDAHNDAARVEANDARLRAALTRLLFLDRLRANIELAGGDKCMMEYYKSEKALAWDAARAALAKVADHTEFGTTIQTDGGCGDGCGDGGGYGDGYGDGYGGGFGSHVHVSYFTPGQTTERWASTVGPCMPGQPFYTAKSQFSLVAHLYRQRAFNERTFGPGPRTSGILAHIRKELAEIEAAPADLSEWIDVVILACDGAMRMGHTPEQVAAALSAKQVKNESRTWPDWRTVPEGKPIEHDRSGEGNK